jgi:hypothetical protein
LLGRIPSICIGEHASPSALIYEFTSPLGEAESLVSGYLERQPLPMNLELPVSISQALGPLVSAVRAAGFVPSSFSESQSFGNFSVTFSNAQVEFSVARDRGQFIVSGPAREVLESAGLWQAFDGTHQLTPLLEKWLLAREQG